MAAVWADDEKAEALHHAMPGAPFGILRLLERRSGGRGLVYAGCASRHSACALAANKSYTGGEAQGS
jgi:hypothetical protein